MTITERITRAKIESLAMDNAHNLEEQVILDLLNCKSKSDVAEIFFSLRNLASETPYESERRIASSNARIVNDILHSI